MANISKRQLKRKVFEHINRQLLSQLTRYRTKKQARIFTEELLTKTEQVMLAKRLMTLVMLERGYSFSIIERVLKVTSKTVVKLQGERRRGLHSRLLAQYARRRDSARILDVVEVLLQAGLPPRGKGRWKDVFKVYNTR